jgi:hypothetical protein
MTSMKKTYYDNGETAAKSVSSVNPWAWGASALSFPEDEELD